MKSIYEIILKEVVVNENGRMPSKNGVNAMSVTLHYPRENVPNSTCLRNFSTKLEDKVPLSLKSEPFHHQLLFKEEFRGESMIEVVLTSVKKAKKLDKFLIKLIGTTVGAAIGTITGLGPIPIAALSQASKSLFELAEPEDEIDIIGKGHFPLNDDITDSEIEIPITLSVPKDVEIDKALEERNDEMVLVKRVLKKGVNNGLATIVIRKLD